MRSVPLHETIHFTHQSWDRVAQIAAFSDAASIAIDGVAGAPLGTVALAPARAASLTGDQLTLLLHLRPSPSSDGPTYYVAKGERQYGLYQPDRQSLTFVIDAEGCPELTVPVPDTWYDQWHTVAAVYSGQEMALVVDGALLGKQAASGLIRYGVGGLLLGQHVRHESAPSGTIAALQLFDGARDHDQLTAITDDPGSDCRIDLRLGDMLPYEAPMPTKSNGAAPSPLPLQKALDAWVPDDNALSAGVLPLPSDLPRDATELSVDWQVAADGFTVNAGTLGVNNADDTLSIPYGVSTPEPGTAYWLTLAFSQQDGDKTISLGQRQFLLPLGLPPKPGPMAAALPLLEIKENDNVGYFNGENFAIQIDLPTATIISWTVDDEELLELGPLHQLWRAPHWEEVFSNDDQDALATQWSYSGLAETMMGVTAMEALQNMPPRVVLQFKGLIIRRNSDVLFEVERDYAIHGNGEVILTQRLHPKAPLPPLGRMGMELRLPKDMDTITWFGRGPEEVYTSSAHGDLIGRYETQAHDDYPRTGWPREHGHKLDVQWLTARNSAGRGLFVGSHRPFAATLSPYTTFQLTEALAGSTLTPDSAYTLHLDHQLNFAPNSPSLSGETIETQFRMRGLLPEDVAPWEYLKTGLPRDDEETA